jgi:hypothetical protein
MNNFVHALTVYNNELIAGGMFTTAGGVSANRIAKWNGTTWAPLGNGIGGGSDPRVNALTVYNNELVVGGLFTTAGIGVSANSIAKWNGNWLSLGSGMNGYVYPLTVYNNELIAGGSFTTAGGVSANRIAKWNGTAWAPLGSGMNSYVYALTVYNNELIAGGNFTTAGGVSANYIAKWNGTVWAPLSSGMNSSVYALTVYNNELIAGGNFTTAGGVSANFIAKWFSPFGVKSISSEIPKSFFLFQNYPNPFNPSTTIRFDIPKTLFITLTVYDVSGKEIETPVNEELRAGSYQVDFDGSNLSSGIYFYKLIADSYIVTKKMVLIK